jgi:hypothetical protein
MCRRVSDCELLHASQRFFNFIEGHRAETSQCFCSLESVRALVNLSCAESVAYELAFYVP